MIPNFVNLVDLKMVTFARISDPITLMYIPSPKTLGSTEPNLGAWDPETPFCIFFHIALPLAEWLLTVDVGFGCHAHVNLSK